MPVTINGTSGITTPGLDASGTNKFATTIGVGGATPAASGAGITFPAIQSASSNANTLDDYEEGTFSFTIRNASGSASVTGLGGSYTKVGRLVHITLNAYNINCSALPAGDHLYLDGLPFSFGVVGYACSIFSNYPAQPVSGVDGVGAYFPLYVPATAVDFSPFTRNTWGGNTQMTFRGSFTYQTST